MITLSGVSKSYTSQQHDRPALSDISLTVEPGQMVAVVGPNGAGKSTLLGLMSGILTPDTGTITGSPICSVILQKTALDPLLTIRENAMVFARVYSIAPTLRKKRLEEFAATTGLQDRLDDRVKTLSGGLARRADLLRAVMVGPELLVLDEPTAGLDRTASPEIMTLLDQFRQEHSIGIVLVTHNLEEAEPADLVLMLQNGEMVARGAPKELLDTIGSGMVFTLEAEAIDRILESPQTEVNRLGDRSVLVDTTQHERIASGLLASKVPYSVRSLTLADVYDRVMGGES